MALKFSCSASRELRRAAGLSRTDLAVAIGRTHPMVAKYEQGRNVPPPEVAERIAAALGVSVGALYVEVEDPPVQAAWATGDPDPHAQRRLAGMLFGGGS